MKFRTETEPSAISAYLAERAEAYSAQFRDPREKIAVLEKGGGMLRLRVRDGIGEGDKLDFSATVSRTKEGFTLIDGEVMPANDGHGRSLSLLYSATVSLFARLTVLLLLYGAVLGISFLVGGRSFLFPAIPSLVLGLAFLVRAVRIRLTLSRRISDFFCTSFACTNLDI